MEEIIDSSLITPSETIAEINTVTSNSIFIEYFLKSLDKSFERSTLDPFAKYIDNNNINFRKIIFQGQLQIFIPFFIAYMLKIKDITIDQIFQIITVLKQICTFSVKLLALLKDQAEIASTCVDTLQDIITIFEVTGRFNPIITKKNRDQQPIIKYNFISRMDWLISHDHFCAQNISIDAKGTRRFIYIKLSELLKKITLYIPVCETSFEISYFDFIRYHRITKHRYFSLSSVVSDPAQLSEQLFLLKKKVHTEDYLFKLDMFMLKLITGIYCIMTRNGEFVMNSNLEHILSLN